MKDGSEFESFRSEDGFLAADRGSVVIVFFSGGCEWSSGAVI
jgi:hypothetical protein